MYVNTVVLHGWRDQVIMKWSRNWEEEIVIEKYFDVVNVTDLEDAAAVCVTGWIWIFRGPNEVEKNNLMVVFIVLFESPLPGASIPIVPLSQPCLVSFYF